MSAQNRDLSTTVEKTLLFWRFWLDRDVGDSFSVWRDVFLCAILADTHVDYLPPICQHTRFQSNVASESGYVSVLRSLFVSICVFLRIFLFVCLRVSACLNTPVWWWHVLMHLLRKCCQNMLTPQPRGLWTARGDEWVGKECVCTLCIWATSPFSSNCTRQKLKHGGCRRCLHEWVNLYHVCHRKIKALVYSGARLSAPISISKLRRRHRRELSHRGRPDRGYNCTHVASPRWLVEAIKYGHLCERGRRRWAHVGAFLRIEEGREGWRWGNNSG